MVTNADLTIYHKRFDNSAKVEKWTRYNYDNIWWFGGRGAGINKGIAEANDVDIRIPYENRELDFKKFTVGDIVVKGHLNDNIQKQQDLKQYEIYNITSLNNNDFGGNPHIHVGAK